MDRPGKRTSDAGNRQQLGGFGIGKLLGAGGFGSVELRVDRATNTEYACKKLNACILNRGVESYHDRVVFDEYIICARVYIPIVVT